MRKLHKEHAVQKALLCVGFVSSLFVPRGSAVLQRWNPQRVIFQSVWESVVQYHHENLCRLMGNHEILRYLDF